MPQHRPESVQSIYSFINKINREYGNYDYKLIAQDVFVQRYFQIIDCISEITRNTIQY